MKKTVIYFFIFGSICFGFCSDLDKSSSYSANTLQVYVFQLKNFEEYQIKLKKIRTIVPVYDLDGNMTSYNGWNYTYNGENRLIVAENVATGVRVEADYDYMGRRLFKKVYDNNTLTKHSVFIYDGFKQINNWCHSMYVFYRQ